MIRSRRLAGWISATGALLGSALVVGPSGCSTSTLTIGTETPDAGGGTDFVSVDASRPESGETTGGACPTTACPAGRATCPSNPFPCAVDFLYDNYNCGGCGNVCPTLAGNRAVTTCLEGTCVLKCNDSYADCNGYGEDGCEVNVASDKNNCGGCGVVCAALEKCENYQCVCEDRRSCGACGNICPEDPTLPAFPDEWHAEYSCSNDLCNQPVCKKDWADCNADFRPPSTEGNGCETFITTDPKNCGGCGITCGAGEECSGGECICRCGSSCFQKLDYDTKNCGACGVQCVPLTNGNADAICDHGVCDYRCRSSHADCDRDFANGCETNILSDPLNCGGCGIRCTGVEGQACVDGKCAMTECTVQ